MTKKKIIKEYYGVIGRQGLKAYNNEEIIILIKEFTKLSYKYLFLWNVIL